MSPGKFRVSGVSGVLGLGAVALAATLMGCFERVPAVLEISVRLPGAAAPARPSRATPPADIDGMDCFFAAVVGPGIEPSFPEAKCLDIGVNSPLRTKKELLEAPVTLRVPAGRNRVVKVLGVATDEAGGCSGKKYFADFKGAKVRPELYEVGVRGPINLLRDSKVEVDNGYNKLLKPVNRMHFCRFPAGPALRISPSSANVPLGNNPTFVASGGTGGDYRFGVEKDGPGFIGALTGVFVRPWLIGKSRIFVKDGAGDIAYADIELPAGESLQLSAGLLATADANPAVALLDDGKFLFFGTTTGDLKGTVEGEVATSNAYAALIGRGGAPRWRSQIGDSGESALVYTAAVNPETDDVYVMGLTSGVLGTPLFGSSGTFDIFVTRWKGTNGVHGATAQLGKSGDTANFDGVRPLVLGRSGDTAGKVYFGFNVSAEIGDAFTGFPSTGGFMNATVARLDADLASGSKVVKQFRPLIATLDSYIVDLVQGEGDSLYVLGRAKSRVVPSANASGVTSTGLSYFIALLDSDLDLVKVEQRGTASSTDITPKALYRDAGTGDIYVAGETKDNISGGSATGNGTAGTVDLFVARYDKDLTLKWVRRLQTNGSSSLVPAGLFVADGLFHVWGKTDGSFGASDIVLGTSGSGQDAFLATLSVSNGDFQWAVRIATGSLPVSPGYVHYHAGQDRYYLTAKAQGTSFTELGTSGGYELVVVKLKVGTPVGGAYPISTDEAVQFGAGSARQVDATPPSDLPRSLRLVVTAANPPEIYVCGRDDGLLRDGERSFPFHSFLMKFDSDLELKWKKRLGTGFSDGAHSCFLDAQGYIHLYGQTATDLDGLNFGNPLGFGSLGPYLIKYDDDGTVQ